jgi:ATP-binding cassette subfamily B protein
MLGKVFAEGAELSSGQWQKVALARAFYRNSPVLILDEPTASIDAKAESEIFDHVGKLTQDKTVFIISHRFSTVRNADKIYVLNKGKIKESGTHDELMKQKGIYAELFHLQAKGYK